MSRRNVLVILCDQLRPDFLSLYGGRAVPTPSLDRLAREGVVFDKAITQSTVCAPARATMMTGRYVSDHGVWTNDLPFRDGMETLPRRLNELGYLTGAFGKLHHYPPDDTKGFQVARQMEEGRLGAAEPYLQWLRERHPEVTRIWNAQDMTFSFGEAEYYEHWIASQAIEFFAAADAPFLAWVSFQGPHGPYDPPQECQGTVDETALPLPLERPAGQEEIPETVLYRQVCGGTLTTAQWMRRRVAYAEMIVAIDRQIGRLLDGLEQSGHADDTTILFAADHGDLIGDFGLDAKGPFAYQAQLAVPMLVARQPGLPAGTRSARPVGTIDIPGTVLDIAGDDRPLGSSRSMVDWTAPGREVLYCEFCDSTRVADDGRWRYCYYPLSGRAELFDRAEDPRELVNLAGRPETAEVERRMLQHLVDFQIVAKGPRVESHDFVPEVQRGLAAKHPAYRRDYEVCFPLSRRERERLIEAGLDGDYLDWCHEKEVLRQYGRAYWQEP